MYAGNYGFAIKVDRDYLITLFSDVNLKVANSDLPLVLHHGKIDYVNINEVNMDNFHQFDLNTRILGFHKDVSFSHEKEYRFLIKIAQRERPTDAELKKIKAGLRVYANNFDWTKVTVFLNPNMPDWALNHSEEILKQLNTALTVCKSKIKLR